MLTVASYNVHKCVGLDRRRDPERIMAVLREINADIVALQEADRRFGSRASAIPLPLIEQHSPYLAVQFDTRPDSIGWHGNAMLIRKDMAVLRSAIVPLPTLEPRGAISVDVAVGGAAVRVVGMHLDLSGLRRRHQVRAVCAHVAACGPPLPLVMMGDLNEWSAHGGALREFGDGHRVLAPGRSFHARRPIAMLDRIITSADVAVQDVGVHHSALSARASDHLPVWTRIII
ncbi:MAG: endonuclease/exonuclease/phosphatase family protein [Sphingopyxis sp.]